MKHNGIDNKYVSDSDSVAAEQTTETETKKLALPIIQCPTIETRYRIDDADISLLFYAFQMVVQNNVMELNIEENVQHIM